MNIQSNTKRNSAYFLILFTFVSLFSLSSCGEETDKPQKLDYATLMSGEYEGNLTVGPNLSFKSKATITKLNDTEVTFTEKIKKENGADSTTTFKIELRESNTKEGVVLRIPEQTVQGVQIVGVALKEEDPLGRQGYFLYQDKDDKKLNQITFLVTANGGVYYYNYVKKE